MASSTGDYDYVIGKALDEIRIAANSNLQLKDEQEVAIRSLLEGRDVLAVLPTGYGKSLIYQVYVRAKNHITDGKATILVISPLNSIIRDQVEDMNSMGYQAVDISTMSSEDILKSEAKIFYTSAEKVQESSFRNIIKHKDEKDNTSAVHHVSCIVVDESHTVETWTGKRKTKGSGPSKKGFRDAYGELAVLRSLLKEGIPVLALTATADKETQSTIMQLLAMKDNIIKLFVSPNRENIRISVCEAKKKEIPTKLDWLVDEVKLKGKEAPKTIIFCNTLKDIATVVNLLLLKLGKHAFIPYDSKKREDLLIGIYHSVSWPKYKEGLLNTFQTDGKKRIIVASTALSMGVNFGDVRYIINWGPARSLLDQLQEIGRAGRDAKQSHVIIIFHGNQLSKCEESVKDFVKSKGCYRVAAYKAFDAAIEPVNPGHNCCNYCLKQCRCAGDNCTKTFLFESEVVQDITPLLERHVTEQDKAELRDALVEVLQTTSPQNGAFGTISSHYFSLELIDDIVEKCNCLFSIQDIIYSLPVFSMVHAIKILEVLQETFEDIPSFENDMSLFGGFDSLYQSPMETVPYFEGYFDVDDYNDELDSDEA